MAASAAAVISSSAVSAAAVVPSGSSAGLIGQVVLGNKSFDLDKSVSAGEVESALVIYLASRSFYIGEGITQDEISAKYENGILQLKIPKKTDKAVAGKNYIAIEG